MRIGLTLTVALCACSHYVFAGAPVIHTAEDGHSFQYVDPSFTGVEPAPGYTIGVEWPPLYGMVFRDPNNAAVVAEPVFQHLLGVTKLMTNIFGTPLQTFLKKMHHDGHNGYTLSETQGTRKQELQRCEIVGGNPDYMEIQHAHNVTFRVPNELMQYKIKYLAARWGADLGFGILWFKNFQKRWAACSRVNPQTRLTNLRQKMALTSIIGIAVAPIPIENGTQALYRGSKSGRWCAEGWVKQFPLWSFFACPDKTGAPLVKRKPYHTMLDWSAMHRDKMVIVGNVTTDYYLNDPACNIPNGALTSARCFPLGLPLRNMVDADGNQNPLSKEWAFNNGMMIARSTYDIRYGLTSGREIGDITNDDHSYLFASERLTLLNWAFGKYYCNEFGLPNEGGFGSFEEYILWESYAAKLFGGNRNDFGDTHAAAPGTCTNANTWGAVAKVWMTGRNGRVPFNMKWKGPLGHEKQLAYTRAFKILNEWKFIRVFIERTPAQKAAPVKKKNLNIKIFFITTFIWGRVYRMPLKHQMRTGAF